MSDSGIKGRYNGKILVENLKIGAKRKGLRQKLLNHMEFCSQYCQHT
jgi:hypothetical protein